MPKKLYQEIKSSERVLFARGGARERKAHSVQGKHRVGAKVFRQARAAHAGAGCEPATCRLEIGLRALKPLNPRTHRNVAHRLRRRAQSHECTLPSASRRANGGQKISASLLLVSVPTASAQKFELVINAETARMLGLEIPS